MNGWVHLSARLSACPHMGCKLVPKGYITHLQGDLRTYGVHLLCRCLLTISVCSFKPIKTCLILHPTLCSYLMQPLTLVWAWTLLIKGFQFHFLESFATLKFYEYTDWLASWTRRAEGSCPLDVILPVGGQLSVFIKVGYISYVYSETSGR